MRSEALDITIESRGSAIILSLAGPFHSEQVPNIKEKLLGFINDGNRHIVINLEQVNKIGDAVVPMFLNLLNTMKGKGGELKFVFKNEVATTAFGPYRHIFAIYPDKHALQTGRFLYNLRRRSLLLSRKTGIRLSRPVALFMLFVLCGWFLTLGYIIWMQNQAMREQEQKIHELSIWKQTTEREVVQLRERIQPLRQLGLLRDTLSR
jgi:anti-anti-sigma factor